MSIYVKTSNASMDNDQDIKIHVINKNNPSVTSTIERAEEEQVFEYKGKDETTVFLVIPPDGGWGWVVVAAAFFSFLMADGILCTFGLFIVSMSQSFNCSKGEVVFVGAITAACVCITGPFTSALINRFGYRKIAIVGSVLAAASCILTAETTSLRVAYVTHGVIGGIGFGMIYLPAVIAVGFYFEKLRALAMGIAVCGAGLGGIVMPPAVTLLLNESGWRYTYKVMGAVACICCVICGFLFKPLKPTKVHVELDDDASSTTTQETMKSFFNRFHNNAHPTLYEVHSKSRSIILQEGKPISDTRLKKSEMNESDTSILTVFQRDRKLEQNVSSEFVVGRTSYCTSTGSSYKNIKSTKPVTSNQNTKLTSRIGQSQLATVHEESKSKWICAKFCENRCSCNNKLPDCTCTCCCKLKTLFPKKTESSNDPIVRPIYRDDIFYSGSLLVLPEYQKYTSQSKFATSSAAASKPAVEYSMAVTRTITQRELVEERTCTLCTEAIKRTLATMLDFSLLKSPSFLLLVINTVFTSMGYYPPYMFIKDRSIQHGVSKNHSFWLISCIGAANTVGRIVCGVLTSVFGVSAIKVTYACLFVGGIATVLSGLSFEVWAQFSYAAVYGFCIACTSGIRTIIIVDLLGLERLTNAIGILLMFQGFAALIGTSTAGLLREITGNYKLSFHFSGGCLILGSIVLIPIKKVSRREKTQAEET